jgi:hypothetical protein
MATGEHGGGRRSGETADSSLDDTEAIEAKVGPEAVDDVSGMWAHRKDMEDPVEWVRKSRRSRLTRQRRLGDP